MDFDDRLKIHAALGDPFRLRIVDALHDTDLTFTEVAALSGLSGNRLAHHLGVLEEAGLLSRRVSEADRRRRYLSVDRDRLVGLVPATGLESSDTLFVCTQNSARSQFAAALWRALTGQTAESAGSTPAPRVNPRAVRVAEEFGVDLSAATPRSYEEVGGRSAVVISVCDRAREGDLPAGRKHLHWSIPDPVRRGRDSAFRTAFNDIEKRIRALSGYPDSEALPCR